MLRVTREIQFQFAGPETNLSSAGSMVIPLSPSACVHAARISLSGASEPTSGMIANVKQIDCVFAACLESLTVSPGDSWNAILKKVWIATCVNWSYSGVVTSIELLVSHGLRVKMQHDPPCHITLTRHYEFSASHRLHSPQLSEQANKELYGKCNNPNGHGHNYLIEISISLPTNVEITEAAIELDRSVNSLVLERFDHKHLNLDTCEFRSRIPTVENIAVVIYELLHQHSNRFEVSNVRVYENSRIWADYRPDHPAN